MKLDFIESLVDLAERARLSELEYREGDSRVSLRFAGTSNGHTADEGSRAESLHPVAQAQPRTSAADASAVHTITSPLVGIFYRAPSPDKPPFVAVGDRVEVGQTLAILEAMKMLNPIEADRTGRIVEVLPEDGTSVDFGAPLFKIEEEK
ncbi:acetyl-CoA carboxylase biotin carboxyl carrier protein [Pseudomonas sp. JG-B]|uniref:acetyl-CoA carboxylase biotin carboxyl carrier protein n=1 Tax=Pseudomonas sp. JG-B TaxID=2603214 RepID=UPI00129DBC86|nr:acetyl-CoA carboxylase biotin carboxyl carrier protein [Pseudomonas sp. JG-B]MRK21929.1 acetyl-CoA carboxylase biotin carboxyl carrier protein [Pseudomonas sp. JG-B]